MKLLMNCMLLIMLVLFSESCKTGKRSSKKKKNNFENAINMNAENPTSEAETDSLKVTLDQFLSNSEFTYSEELSYSFESHETRTYSENSSTMSILFSEGSNTKVLSNRENSIKTIIRDIKPSKLLHNINTSMSEYHPAVSSDGKIMAFTGMDRTGYFDTKIDFTKTRNLGGEDIFISEQKNGFWQDAIPLKLLSTNSHEAINQEKLTSGSQ